MSKRLKSREELPYRACVGVMVLNAERKVWVGHRAGKKNEEFRPDDKRWQMPQGGIDDGEEPLDAAKRELWEETGITSAMLIAEAPDWVYYDLPDELIGVALKGKYRGQKQRWFAFSFEGSETEINITHPPEGAPVEFDKWEWVNMETLPDLIVDFKRRTYEEVVAAFGHLHRR